MGDVRKSGILGAGDVRGRSNYCQPAVVGRIDFSCFEYTANRGGLAVVTAVVYMLAYA